MKRSYRGAVVRNGALLLVVMLAAVDFSSRREGVVRGQTDGAPAPAAQSVKDHDYVSVAEFITTEQMNDPKFDAAPAVQKAIDSAPGGRIFFPTGIYHLHTGVVIGTNAPGTVLEGAGRGNLDLGNGTYSGGAVIQAAENLLALLRVDARFASIRDISFDGNLHAACGILGGCPKGVVERVSVFRTLDAGIKLSNGDAGNAFSWRIFNSNIFGNCGNGIQLGETSNQVDVSTVHINETRIFCNWICGNNKNGVFVGYGNYTTTIEDNDFEDNCLDGRTSPFNKGCGLAENPAAADPEVASVLVAKSNVNVRIVGNHFEHDCPSNHGPLPNPAGGNWERSFVRVGDNCRAVYIASCHMNNAPPKGQLDAGLTCAVRACGESRFTIEHCNIEGFPQDRRFLSDALPVTIDIVP